MGDLLTEKTIYAETVLSRAVVLPITMVGIHTNENIRMALSTKYEGKCIEEGYMRSNSIQIMKYSCGIAEADKVVFHVTFTCLLCSPVAGMRVECYVKNIHKGGVRAEMNEKTSLDTNTPIVIHLARDHHYHNAELLNDIQLGQKIRVEIVGVRYELNDPFVQAIASYIE